jgi:hypothetical protein
MNQQFGPLLYTVSIWALQAIIAITFHEAAHGFVARLLGDDTAYRLGRARNDDTVTTSGVRASPISGH